MIPLTLILSFITGLYIGHKYKTLQDAVDVLKEAVEQRRKKEEDTPDSIVLDPDDEIQRTRLEQKELLRKLNPDDDL